MIGKVWIIFLIECSHYSCNAFENRFCDDSYKDSLLSLGGIFSIDDTLLATRRYPNNDQNIVWKFKLKAKDFKSDLKDNKFEIIEMSSHQMETIFPGLSFEYFVSGFAITDINSCNNSEECVNTSNREDLIVILGPKQNSSQQFYAIYRFNGNSFKAVQNNDVLPLALKAKGTTSHWFTPKSFITTTSRQKQNQIIAFNYGDKTINQLNVKMASRNKLANKLANKADNKLANNLDYKIANPFWKILMSVSVHSFSYHLIELKVSDTQREILLITQQMVYQLIDNKILKEVTLPKVSLRSEQIVEKNITDLNFRSNETDVNLHHFDDLPIFLFVELFISNAIYISIVLIAFYKN